MTDMQTVRVNGRVYRLPFVDLVPFDEEQMESLGEKIKAAGRVNVPIVCWTEKKTKTTDTVIDGAHRVIHAAALGLKKIPVIYLNFKTEEEARAKCEELNYERRHLTPEQLHDRRQERIARIAAARAEGQSTRTIAAAEGISQPQVRRDLTAASENTESGETGVSPETPETQEIQNGAGSDNGSSTESTVTGKDGKTYPAKKPKILCVRCSRVGAVADCPACEIARVEARKQQKLKDRRDAERDREPGDDEQGMNLPASVKAALADTWHLDSARLLAQLRTQCKTAFNWSVYLDADVLEALKLAEQYFLSAAPKKLCGECMGAKKRDGVPCLECKASGYLASNAV